MFRLSAYSVLKIGGEVFKKDTTLCKNICSVMRLSQSAAQVTSLDNVRTMQDNPHIVPLVNAVRDLGFNEDQIKSVINRHPGLLQKSAAVWSSVLGTLLEFSFEKRDVLSILKKWPDVLSMKESELSQNLEAWFRCDLGAETTVGILTKHPTLLQVPHTTVEKRIKQYQAFFEIKKKAGTLLLLAPNTLVEDWSELLDKLNYLDELCTEKSDIVCTGVLAYSPLHVRARHEFLIKAGVYKRPGKNYNKKLSKNPKLTDIVNSSDKEFVKIAGLSVLEYEIFLEMYKKEYEEIKSLELDSDEDEEQLKKLNYLKFQRSFRKQ